MNNDKILQLAHEMVWRSTDLDYSDDDRAVFAKVNAFLRSIPPPSVVRVVLEEGNEILINLMESILRRGNYSAESTITFIDNALQCFRIAFAIAPAVDAPPVSHEVNVVVATGMAPIQYGPLNPADAAHLVRDQPAFDIAEQSVASQLCSCKASERDGQHMAWCSAIAPVVQPKTISAQDPRVIIAGIRQFGLASDGSDLRDLEAAIVHSLAPDAAQGVGDTYDGRPVAGNGNGDPACMNAVASNEPCKPLTDDHRRCAICGFIVDMSFKAEKPTIDFTMAGRNKPIPPASGAEPVGWRWKPKDSTLWIYNPTSEWMREHANQHDLEFEPLYAAPPRPGIDRNAVIEALKNAAIFLEVGSRYAPNEPISDRNAATGEILKTRGLADVMRTTAAECRSLSASQSGG